MPDFAAAFARGAHNAKQEAARAAGFYERIRPYLDLLVTELNSSGVFSVDISQTSVTGFTLTAEGNNTEGQRFRTKINIIIEDASLSKTAFLKKANGEIDLVNGKDIRKDVSRNEFAAMLAERIGHDINSVNRIVNQRPAFIEPVISGQ